MGISSLASAGIAGASSLFGAATKAGAAKDAAAAQVAAGQNATNALTGALQTSTSQLSPYTDTGSAAVHTLGNDLAGLASPVDTPQARYVDPNGYGTDAVAYQTSPTANNVSGTANNISGTADNVSADPYKTTGDFTEADLEATPGYQFTLNQGEKGVQNSAAARGLGISGAALKGAATYATGLSDQTYNTRFTQQLGANAQNFGQENTAATTNFGQKATAAGTNFGQQAEAGQINYGQQSGANEQNFGNNLKANSQNFTNALTAAGQNFNMDQTGFSDASANATNSYNKLIGTSGLGESATGLGVQANTTTAGNEANALVGVGNAQAAGDNAQGQAWGNALTGLGTTAGNAIGSYNGNAVASGYLQKQNVTPGTTFGGALTNLLKSGAS